MIRHAIILAAATAMLAATAAAAADALHPTVIELYQSQGCSSCPPALKNVNALADRPDVLALTFAVTYWDKLGWKDVFAQPAYTARQWDYAKALGHDQVWTPQVIVDGRADVVGAQRGQIERLLAKTTRPAGPTVSVSPTTVAIGRGIVPKNGADIWLVRYDPQMIQVAIKAGENSGRTLGHRNVVRQLVKLGRWTGTAASLSLPAPIDGLSTAVLVQASTGPILAAGRG